MFNKKLKQQMAELREKYSHLIQCEKCGGLFNQSKISIVAVETAQLKLAKEIKHISVYNSKTYCQHCKPLWDREDMDGKKFIKVKEHFEPFNFEDDVEVVKKKK